MTPRPSSLRGRPFQKFAASDSHTKRLARVAARLARVPVGPPDGVLLLRAYLDLIFRQVKAKGRFVVPDFGTFYLRTTKGRQVRNPSTGNMMQLPPRWALAFRCAKSRKGWGEGGAT